MKNILMVGPVPPPTGGIASVMEDIIHSELDSEYSFELFPRPDFEQSITRTIPRNIARTKQLVSFFFKLWRGNYYLVHIHSPDGAFRSTILFILLARLARTNMLVHMHGTGWDEFYTEKVQLYEILHSDRAEDRSSYNRALFPLGGKHKKTLSNRRGAGNPQPYSRSSSARSI